MMKKNVGTAYKSSTVKRTKPRSKIKYIASVETSNNNRREQWAFGRDEHSLTSSGRWTDAKLFSTKKEAEKVSKELASGFNKKENPKPYVRRVYL